jgi:hypothetical protein
MFSYLQYTVITNLFDSYLKSRFSASSQWTLNLGLNPAVNPVMDFYLLAFEFYWYFFMTGLNFYL